MPDHNQHRQARKVWAAIAWQKFPLRHEKSNEGNKARDMIKSMIAHGKSWRRWAKEHKISVA